MASLNTCHFIGNLTKDVEVKYTTKGTAIADFSLAINRNYTTADGEKREETTFLEFTAWAKLAELIGEYCKKGRPLYVEARAVVDSWDDKETGKKRYKTKFIAEEVQFLVGGDRGEVKAPKGPATPEDDIPMTHGEDTVVPF